MENKEFKVKVVEPQQKLSKSSLKASGNSSPSQFFYWDNIALDNYAGSKAKKYRFQEIMKFYSTV